MSHPFILVTADDLISIKSPLREITLNSHSNAYLRYKINELVHCIYKVIFNYDLD